MIKGIIEADTRSLDYSSDTPKVSNSQFSRNSDIPMLCLPLFALLFSVFLNLKPRAPHAPAPRTLDPTCPGFRG